MWADHDKRSEETNCLNCQVQCNLSFSYKFCNLLEKDEWWNYNSKTMKTYLRRVSIWGMLHGVCTVVYAIFLFQRKWKTLTFRLLGDKNDKTKHTNETAITIFKWKNTGHHFTWLSCKLYSLFLCKSHYVHLPNILFQNVVELLSQLNKIRINGRQFQERSTCVSNGPTSSTFKFRERDFKLVGNQDIWCSCES